MSKSIVLIGMMGCGKSSCGRELAKRMGRQMLDTDRVIEARAGCTVAELFASRGESAFRDMETELAKELAGKTDLVIATGGGMVLRPENVELLRQSGTLVFLNRSPKQIFATTSMAGRPLGQDGEAAFLQRFAQREPIYRRCADVVIDEISSVEQTVDEILKKLEGVQ